MASLAGIVPGVVAKPAPAISPVIAKQKDNAATGSKAKIIVLAEKDGMKEGEPLKEIFSEIGNTLDRFDKAITGFGPESGRLAAEYAGRAVRQDMARLAMKIDRARLGSLTLTGVALLAGAFAAGWFGRERAAIYTPAGPMPPAMAERFGMQDWQRQWAARRTQPMREGYEWVLVPFVIKQPDF